MRHCLEFAVPTLTKEMSASRNKRPPRSGKAAAFSYASVYPSLIGLRDAECAIQVRNFFFLTIECTTLNDQPLS